MHPLGHHPVGAGLPAMASAASLHRRQTKRRPIHPTVAAQAQSLASQLPPSPHETCRHASARTSPLWACPRWRRQPRCIADRQSAGLSTLQWLHRSNRWQASSHPARMKPADMHPLGHPPVGAGLPAMAAAASLHRRQTKRRPIHLAVATQAQSLASQLPHSPHEACRHASARTPPCGSGLARDGGGSLAASPTDRAPAYPPCSGYTGPIAGKPAPTQPA
jgi:hypothetical protein